MEPPMQPEGFTYPKHQQPRDFPYDRFNSTWNKYVQKYCKLSKQIFLLQFLVFVQMKGR